MIRDKLPAMTHFFTCYFHEDLMLEVPDAESAINSYLDDESPSSIMKTINELEDLLKTDHLEEELTGILNELGCRYSPAFQGMSNIEWLRWIQSLLKKTIK